MCLVEDGRQHEVYDAREFYPWVSVGRLYGVVSPRPRGPQYGSHGVVSQGAGGHAYAAAFGNGETPICLTGASKEVLGAFLSKQFKGRFPGVASVTQIGKFLNDVVLPRGTVIADQKVVDDEVRFQPSSTGWIGRGARERDVAVFAALCTGVQGNENGNGWRLQFNGFRPDGGVASLSACGTSVPLTITKLVVEEVKPAGEFYYPLEGARGAPPNRALQRTALARRR